MDYIKEVSMSFMEAFSKYKLDFEDLKNRFVYFE